MSVELRDTADHEFHFAITESPPSVAVVEAIAHVTEQDPLEMTPLADVIDPAAIDRLLSDADTVSISFVFEGHDVAVSGSGEIVVTRREHRS